MAISFTKTGITDGNPILASHITQSYDAFTAQTAYDVTISGSLSLTGSVESYNGFTGSFTGSLNGTFVGYDTAGSPVSLKVGFYNNITIPNPMAPVTVTPVFPLNQIVSVIFTVVGTYTGLDWYPILSSSPTTTFQVGASDTSAAYMSPVTVNTTIFYY